MEPDVLGKLLVGRLRQHKSLDKQTLMEFVGIAPLTLRRWLKKPAPGKHAILPKGERLNRLWHFLAAVGISSPELDALPAYHRTLGELHAFGVVPLVDTREAGERDTDLIQILDNAHAQAALRVMRGEQTPQEPQIGTAEELLELYGEQLAEAKEKWRIRFAEALPAGRTTQATDIDDHADDTSDDDEPGEPQEPDEPDEPEEPDEDDTPEPVVDTPEPAEVAITAVVPPDEEATMEPTVVNLPSQLMAAVNLPPALTPTETSARDNFGPTFELARMLASMMPLLNYLLSEDCSDADRALLRELVGRDNLHGMSRGISRLTSTRSHRS